MINKGFMRFGGGGETLLTPLGFAMLLIAAVLILVVRRKNIIIPLLFAVVFISLSQRVVLAGLHFTSMRMLIACAWLRILSHGFGEKVRLTKIDKAFIAWAISGAFTFTLLWASADALVNRVGVLYDCLGMYFLLRSLLPSEASISRAISVMSVISFCLGICMLAEHFTAINVFWVFGGVPKVSDVRDGHIRAQGPFAHAILAGSFGATLMPLFTGMWWEKRSRAISVLGMLGASAMAYSSSSSTAFLAWGAGLAALFSWPLRRYARVFRWSVVLILAALQLVMKAPVWALIARVDLTGGSSSYHRFELVNQAILHFWDWWLLGEKTTYQWGYNLWDTSNTYVETATTGGLCTLVLLLTIIVVSFKALGRLRKSTSDPSEARFTWILGAALTSHLVAFIGIMYYDQTVAGWYLLLAITSAVTTHCGVPRPVQKSILIEGR
jgi:hypothetical protein